MANTIQGYNGIGIWVGQVAPNQTDNDTDINGHGIRVRVRILYSSLPDGRGTHSIGSEIANKDLPLAIVKLPTTHGNGNRLSSGIIGGETVMGFFLDSKGQIPVIDGVLARTINENEVTAQEATITTNGKRLDPYSQKRSNVPSFKRIGGPPPEKPATPTRKEVGLTEKESIKEEKTNTQTSQTTTKETTVDRSFTTSTSSTSESRLGSPENPIRTSSDLGNALSTPASGSTSYRTLVQPSEEQIKSAGKNGYRFSPFRDGSSGGIFRPGSLE